MTTWWLILSLIQTTNWGVSNSSHVHRKSRGSMVQLRVRRAVLVQRENSFSQNTARQWQVYRSQIYVNTTCAGKGGDVITIVSSINPLKTAYCLFSGVNIRFKLDSSHSRSWNSLCCTKKSVQSSTSPKLWTMKYYSSVGTSIMVKSAVADWRYFQH